MTGRGVSGMWTDPVWQAKRSATRIRRFLRSRGVDVTHDRVVRLLVLWGPGVPEVAGGYQRVGEVRVVVGKQAKQWRRRLALLGAGAPPVGAREAPEGYVAAYRPAPT